MALKNFQYNKILREYDSRQFKNRHDLELRTKAVYEEIPALSEIDNLIISKSIASAKSLFSDDDAVLEQLKEDNHNYSLQKKRLLLAHGYDADYLSQKYGCNDCKDTGYINNKKCHCFKQAIVDLVYSQSNIKSAIKIENFETFSYEYYSSHYIEETTGLTPLNNAQNVVKSCRSFITDFDHHYSNLLLYGNTGVGKTFLANCIAKELLDSAHTVIYLTSFQLFDILEKNKFAKGGDNYEAQEQFDYILDCDLLIIDDLGTELNNTFTTSQLYLCINERHLRQKSTVISTNLSWNDLNTVYSERIFSRITSNYILLKIVGDDIRLKKAFSP